MRKLLTLLLILTSCGAMAQVPAAEDTTRTATTLLPSPQWYYKTTLYGRQYYLSNSALAKNDFIINSKYLRAYYWRLFGGNTGNGNQALSSGNFTTANGSFGSQDVGTGRVGYHLGTRLYDAGTPGNYLDAYSGGNVLIASDGNINLTAVGAINVNSDDAHSTHGTTYVNGVSSSSITATNIGISNSSSDKYNIIQADRVRLQNGAGTIYTQLSQPQLEFGNSGFSGILSPPTFTANRIWSLPDASGTVALFSDISGGYVPYTGATTNLTMGANSVSAQNYATSGTAGVGYYEVGTQSVSPTASTNKLRIYSDSLNRLSWKNSTYRRTLRVARASDYTASYPWKVDPILVDSTEARAAYVPQTRTLTAGYGINTIGDLSANRTITADTTTIIAKNFGVTGNILFRGPSALAQNKNLFWDNTNNRLGINNSAPAMSFDVTGTINVTSGITLASSSIVATESGGAAFNKTSATRRLTWYTGANNTVPKMILENSGDLKLTLVSSGTAGTDSLITKNPTTNAVGKISANYYATSAIVAPAAVVSSAGTLTLSHGIDYIFTGTTATYTLPAVSGATTGRAYQITIKNRGSGNLTLNSNTGSTIYSTAAVGTITISAGSAVTLMPDGTYFNQE